MTQKIIKIGSSSGITLSSSALLQAGLKPGSKVVVSVGGDGVIMVKSITHDADKETLVAISKLLESNREEISKINGQ